MVDTNVELPSFATDLINLGLIDAEVLYEAQQKATSQNIGLLPQLIDSKVLDEEALAVAYSKALHLPLMDLEGIDPVSLPPDTQAKTMAKKGGVLVLRYRQGRVVVVTANPLSDTLDQLARFVLASSVDWVVVEATPLKILVAQYLAGEPDLEDKDDANSEFKFSQLDDFEVL